MIFVREINPAVETLCEKLCSEVGKNKGAKMGAFVAPVWLRILAWGIAVIILLLNIVLLYQTIAGWLA